MEHAQERVAAKSSRALLAASLTGSKAASSIQGLTSAAHERWFLRFSSTTMQSGPRPNDSGRRLPVAQATFAPFRKHLMHPQILVGQLACRGFTSAVPPAIALTQESPYRARSLRKTADRFSRESARGTAGIVFPSSRRLPGGTVIHSPQSLPPTVAFARKRGR